VPERFDILAVGRLGVDLRPAFAHYERLLAGLCRLTVREVREVPLQGRAAAEVVRDEGRRLLAALPAGATVVALDVAGRAYDTEAFAARLRSWAAHGPATFVLGGSLGLSDEVKAAAGELLSLSPLTLPHQLARVVLAEQLFRGLKIARGEAYHH
jgi:23S rRNA (pseudouridine1915-N3)-methyltransferase